jgi:outer membrane receptor protein involved in Fe transport
MSQYAHSQTALVYQDSILTTTYKLKEVSISSSKELHKLKALPASISLVSSVKIQDNRIEGINDLSSIVPNLFMPDYGSRLTSPIYIRGIGSKIGTPSVGLYIDNVPYFEKSCFDFDFSEIESIEVLRGPQGTLYGRNTMGGIINIHTKSPENFNGNSIYITKGQYANTKIGASTYNSINDKLSYSFSAAYNHEGGFFTNKFTGEQVDDLDSYNVSTKLVNVASDFFKTVVSINFQGHKQGGYPYGLLNKETNKVAPVNYNRYSSYDRDILSASVYNEYTNNNIVMGSSTAYNYYTDAQNIDQDFTVADKYFINYNENQHMISQEFTLKSKKDSKYKWLIGAFGFYQNIDAITNVTLHKDKLAEIHLNDYSYAKANDTKTIGAALFHQSTLALNKFSISGGIRVDYESTRLNFKYDKTVNSNKKNVDKFDNKLSYFEVIPKASIKYHHNENNFIYVTLAKGYKAGGFNSIIEDENEKTFDPESSWNYELGIKTNFLKNRFFINIAGFYIDWDNQQITKTPTTGQGVILFNAGRSVSKGFEIDARAIILKDFEAQISYGYTDAKFKEYSTSKKGVKKDYSGKYIPYIPKETLSLGLSYKKIINSSFLDEIRVNGTYKAIGNHYWDIENVNNQSYYYTIDSSISFIMDNLSVDLWGKNITSRDYWAYYFAMGPNSYVQTGKPAQWGLSLKYNF